MLSKCSKKFSESSIMEAAVSKYVLSTWYPLTWSRNVGRELSAHRVVERDVVLFRSQDGKVVAMEDACPHRLLPLSMGRLKGDAIECGYHGVVFDCTGKCMRVPGQEMIPANAVVKTFPTRKYGARVDMDG